MRNVIDKLLISHLRGGPNEMDTPLNGKLKVNLDLDEPKILVELEIMSPSVKTVLGEIEEIMEGLYTIHFKYKVYQLLKDKGVDTLTKVIIQRFPNRKDRLLEYLTTYKNGI